MSCEKVSQYTRLPLSEIQKLKETLNTQDFVEEAKEGVTTMCKIFEDMQKEVAKKTAMEIAKKLILLEHWSCEKVSQYTKLPLEENQKLKKELQVQDL